MSTEFKEKLCALAQRSVVAAPRCTNEESAKMFLVLPVIALFGYDHLNPNEVYPEHHADFSEKFKRRADFAILRDDQPIIAIECKSVGNVAKDDLGQLKSYFNAAKTVKMGVLTDGMRWDFFADSEDPNLMDDKPFLSIDMEKIAKGHLDDSTAEALQSLQRDKFDPNNIGAEAKRKHVFNAVLLQIKQISLNPPELFCRMLLKNVGVEHISQKVLGEYTPVIRQAFAEYVNQVILARMGLQPPAQAEPQSAGLAAVPLPEVDPKPSPTIVTTLGELAVFSWTQRRLAYLIRDANLFDELQHINFRDYQGKFVVFYKRERKGRLFDYIEGRADGKGFKHKFIFPDDYSGPEREITVERLEELDEPLLAIFKARINRDAPPTKAEVAAMAQELA